MTIWTILLTLTKWSIKITHYLKSFSTLHSDTSRSRWTAATKFRAPHKPLLLLAVIDLIA
jgi:hypothetical protein